MWQLNASIWLAGRGVGVAADCCGASPLSGVDVDGVDEVLSVVVRRLGDVSCCCVDAAVVGDVVAVSAGC